MTTADLKQLARERVALTVPRSCRCGRDRQPVTRLAGRALAVTTCASCGGRTRPRMTA